ncbi:MAG: DUF4404 family protein [Woeseiaceae bacterium]
MSNEEIRQLLAKLHEEIQKTELDSETQSLMRELDADIHSLVNPDAATDDANPVLERARLLEAKFATNHPTAERLTTEVINILARMGI